MSHTFLDVHIGAFSLPFSLLINPSNVPCISQIYAICKAEDTLTFPFLVLPLTLSFSRSLSLCLTSTMASRLVSAVTILSVVAGGVRALPTSQSVWSAETFDVQVRSRSFPMIFSGGSQHLLHIGSSWRSRKRCRKYFTFLCLVSQIRALKLGLERLSDARGLIHGAKTLELDNGITKVLGLYGWAWRHLLTNVNGRMDMYLCGTTSLYSRRNVLIPVLSSVMSSYSAVSSLGADDITDGR